MTRSSRGGTSTYRDLEELRAAITAVRGDSYWVDVERKIRDIRSGRMTEADARRYYLNMPRRRRGGVHGPLALGLGLGAVALPAPRQAITIASTAL